MSEMAELSLAERWDRIFRTMEDASEKFARCDREMARRARLAEQAEQREGKT